MDFSPIQSQTFLHIDVFVQNHLARLLKIGGS